MFSCDSIVLVLIFFSLANSSHSFLNRRVAKNCTYVAVMKRSTAL